MAQKKTDELRRKAKEILQKAKEQSKKLLEEAEQLENQNKLKIADKAIEFYKENISEDELKSFISSTIDLEVKR